MTAAEIRRVPDAMGAHKRRNRAALKAWEGVPAGTRVRVTRDDGTTLDTRTRSAAYTLGDGTAVILVEGIVGAYALERVTRVRPIPFVLTEKALLLEGAA